MTTNSNSGKMPTPHVEPSAPCLSGTTQEQVQREADYRRKHIDTMIKNGVAPDAARANMPK